ncbi:MAG: STAS domain-containing protein [Candidatus Krumholzibacteriota bacterium]|nr:STAS domain-containing protein [Candidatus Krumholzibacteriota bacterium]
MKIKKKDVDGVTILELSGEMYGGPDNMKLIDVISELIEEKKLDLVINLSKVKWISSTGLGILVSARSRYAKEGGVVKLCQPNDRVLGILQVTRLNLIFDVYESEKEAIEAIGK